jgi:hypothetical protein
MGTRESAGIPGQGAKIPTFKGKLLHALMDMDDWPKYVETHSSTNISRCVSMTWDQLNRLRSFYPYSRSDGEHWVRYETDIMESLRNNNNNNNNNTLKESVPLFWDRIGKKNLLSSHESYLKDEQRGCCEIKFEDLVAKEYEMTIRQILQVFGIPSFSSTEDRPFKILQRHDRSNITTRKEEHWSAKDMHVSSKNFRREMLQEVERIFLHDVEEAGIP